MNIIFIGFLVIFFVFIILSLTFLGMWTYRDAKNRGLNPAGWTAIVILMPNLIGLLFYFLVGRKQGIGNCKKCDAKIPMNSKFCLNCGEETSLVEKTIKPTRKFMTGFIVSIVIMFIAFVSFIITVIFQQEIISKPEISIASMESNIGSKWKVSYYLSTEEYTRSIKIGENGPSKMYLESNSDEGSVYLKLVQGEIEEVIDVTNVPEGTEVDLSKFKEGKIKLNLSNESAKGVKFRAEWK